MGMTGMSEEEESEQNLYRLEYKGETLEMIRGLKKAREEAQRRQEDLEGEEDIKIVLHETPTFKLSEMKEWA